MNFANRKFFHCAMLIDPGTKMAVVEGTVGAIFCEKAFKDPNYMRIH
jgi:hypothetical protein